MLSRPVLVGAGLLLAPIDSFGQVERRLQVADLFQRQRDLYGLVFARVVLGQRYAILEGVDDDVFAKGCFAFVHKGDDGAIECVLNGKHTDRLMGP